MSAVTDRYNGSFGGTGFWQQGSSGMDAAGPSQKAAMQWFHYPGSDNNYRNDSGKMHHELVLTVVAATADLDALEDLLDQQHTLIYAGGSVSAYLDYVQDRRDVPNRGQGTITLGLSY